MSQGAGDRRSSGSPGFDPRQHAAAELGEQAQQEEDTGRLLQQAVDVTADMLDTDIVGIFETIDGEGLSLRSGIGWEQIQRGDVLVPEELGGKAPEERPVVLDDPSGGILDRLGVEDGMTVPLRVRGRSVGLLSVYSTEADRFKGEDLDFLKLVAQAASRALMKEREVLDREIVEDDRYRRLFDDIITDATLPTEEKLRRLLELGCQRLGVENGHIVRIDRRQGRHEIVESAGAELVETGTITDLDQTYCRETIKAQDVLGIHDATQTGFGSHPAYQEWGLGCYVGGRILLEDELYGTLCFVSDEGKQEPFTDSDRAFVDVMARWIGQEIDRVRRTRQLQQERDRFQSLVREIEEYAIFMLDPDGNVQTWNQGAEEIKGYTEDEILGKHFSTFYPDEDQEDGVPQHNLETAAAYGSVQDEGWRVRADGSRFWANVTITALHDEDGELRGFAKVTRDMTRRHRREEELRREKERFESLVEETHEYAIYMLDAEGHVRTWNQGAKDLKGYTKNEILGKHFSIFYTDEDKQAEVPKRTLQSAIEYGNVQDEGWRVRADGSRFWANVSITALKDGDGNLRGFTKVARDMTERRDREQELRRERDRFKALVHNVREYAIFLLDSQGHVRTWNKGARELKGYTKNEILGKHFSTFYTDKDQEEDVPVHNLEGAAEYGSIEDEGWRVRADGSRFWANVTITALHDDGQLRGFAKVTRDMTDRHAREQELRREKERFESLVRETDEYAIFLLNPEGHIETWNQGAKSLKGYSEQEILGEHFSTFYTDDDREEGVPEENLRAAVDDGSTQDEGWRVRADGSRFWANVTITAIKDEEGQVKGFSKVTRDMTERHERERRLRESNQRLEQFAYAASHDLQEPLRMVSTYLQLIEDRYDEHLDEEGREFFEYAVDGAKRMRKLIQSLLEFARVTTEGRDLEPVDAHAALDEALSDLKLQIEEADADIQVGELPRVNADPDQLADVFRNLISNAIKYSGEEPPRIDIRAQPVGDRWRFAVHDEGVGIPEEHTDQVFRVFRRLHDPEKEGIGIGLAVCQQIADRHGGRMWVESEPGEGSTFYFTMPRASAETEDEGASQPA